MEEQAFFTVGEAAKQVGRSKATISNAIKTGKLAVHERTANGYRIAAAELFRVFRPDERQIEQTLTPANDTLNTAALVELEGLRRENALLRDERDDLRRRLDEEAEERRKLTAILTDQRTQQPPEPAVPAPAPPPRKGWRGWLHRMTA
jgi:hypothetical protein